MIIVIIAGGSGTRLWPLSTPDYPKHLLKINNDERSLLQQTYDRARQISEKVYIATEASHVDHVKKQLEELPDDHFIVEPARRGTASAIVAVLAHLKGIHPNDEPIAFLAADHYVRDVNGFAHSFNLAGEVSKSQDKIVLVGVEPDYPATGFGYIQKDGTLEDFDLVYKVDSFKEKPEFNVAREYLTSGNYLWNCGYFVGSVNTFTEDMKEYAPELFANYNKLLSVKPEDYEKTYLEFDNIAIDYGLIEKDKDLLVVPASFDWVDLGSFRDLHNAQGGDEFGNSIYGNDSVEVEEVENSFISNQEDKPLAVIGLDNIVVVNTPKGILVARKDLSQKVGEVSKRFNKEKGK